MANDRRELEKNEHQILFERGWMIGQGTPPEVLQKIHQQVIQKTGKRGA